MVGASIAKPGVLGVAVPKANNSTLRTRGWEVSLNWEQQFSDFSYFVRLNAYNQKTVITKYNNPTGTLSTWYKGKVAGEVWGYTAHDLFRSQKELDNYLKNKDLSFISTHWNTGDIKYLDINHDGKVNNGSFTIGNHGDLSVIGNDLPRYQYGISAGFFFKGFDFSMLWKGTLKRDMYIPTDGVLYWGFGPRWFRSSLNTDRSLDYYRDQPGTKYYGLYKGEKNINTNAYWPRPYLNAGDQSRNRLSNTRYLANLAFMRLKNITIGYNLSEKLTSKMHIQKFRIYLSGQNLLTFDHLPKGLDPVAIYGEQNANFGNIPGRITFGATRNVALGVSISF